MNYCRCNKKKLRADTYQGLIDHLHRKADETNSHVGKMIILPSSFTGSPRNMLPALSRCNGNCKKIW